MATRALILAGCMILGGAISASANCADELARLSAHGGAQTGGISKDGSTAPLQDSGTAAGGSGGAAEGGTVSKDGSNAPLGGTGGASPEAAMSQQDAEAQQQGGATAAEAAAAGSAGGSDAMQRAQAALAAGDEAGCMEAIETLKRSPG